jgi:threonine/homoserine/homoserine lactone efflux protein
MHAFGLLIVILTLGLLSPGPDLILIMKNSLAGHRGLALATAWGICAGLCVHMAYCVVGLGFLIARYPLAFHLMQVTGAFYLMWIGARALVARFGDGQGMTIAPATNAEARRLGFRQGFVTNLLNPKCAFFFMAIFCQMLGCDASLSYRLAVAGVILAHSFVTWTVVVLALSSGWVQRAVMRSRNMIEKVFGGMLVGLGIKVAIAK